MQNQELTGLRSIAQELIQHWRRLLLCSFLGAALGLTISFLSEPSYQVDVLLAPAKNSSSGGSLQGLSGQLGGIASLAGVSLGAESEDAASVAMLKSRLLARSIIEQDHLLPLLFPKKWDSQQQRWKSQDPDEIPTTWDGERRFSKKIRRVSEDRKTGLITLTIVWNDPKMATKWATELVAKTNELLRARAIETAQSNIDYLKQQLDVTSIVEVRQSVYRLVEEQLKTMMLAQGNTEYAFKVLDPAVVPERPAGPSKAILALGGGAIGLLLSSLVSLQLRSGGRRPQL